jgi:hypothetical protein
MNSGLILYVMFAALLALFWRQVRGKSFDDLMDEDSSLHHQVHRVICFGSRAGGCGPWRGVQKYCAGGNFLVHALGC